MFDELTRFSNHLLWIAACGIDKLVFLSQEQYSRCVIEGLWQVGSQQMPQRLRVLGAGHTPSIFEQERAAIGLHAVAAAMHPT